jgi:hypothetical protein
MSRFLVLVFAVLLAAPLSVVPARPALAAVKDNALRFDGTNDLVTFGQATSTLGTASFTLETWFKRASTGGAGTTTGTGGIASAIPLVTKGRGEGETPANVNMNYFLGIDATSGTLVADFEDTINGGNHPVSGTTQVSRDVWHHAAVSYNATTGVWNLYLDGVLDRTLTLASGFQPESSSIQHAGIATAMTSAGTTGAGPAGFFAGDMDEVRIWNVARSQADIQAAMTSELTSGTGLIGRWGLNEGTGTTAVNSIAGSPNGTLTNGPTWVLPPDLTPPAAPAGLGATAGNGVVSLAWTANNDPDLAGYNVYRSTSPGVTKGTPLNGALLTSPAFTDVTAVNGTTYYYAIAAVDTSTNVSGLSGEVSATPELPVPGAYGLDLGSGSAYVAFGNPAKLGLADFTIETWFKRTGAGTPDTTGSGGITSLVPLVTHGSSDVDNKDYNDANWILGINTAGNVIAADFEDMNTGLNHPVSGTTAIADNVWHHAAATYDGTTWSLYLDGNLEQSLTIVCSPASVCIPRSDTIQRAGLGAMITATGTVKGHFTGVLDEVRVWDTAHTRSEIVAGLNAELTSGSGLVARWGMSEGDGMTVADSTASRPLTSPSRRRSRPRSSRSGGGRTSPTGAPAWSSPSTSRSAATGTTSTATAFRSGSTTHRLTSAARSPAMVGSPATGRAAIRRTGSCP